MNAHLSIDGHPGQAPVVEINGRKYVEVDDLARLTSGSISFRGDEIRLQLPGGGTQSPDSANANGKKSQFSKDFLRAGIEQMTVVREWRIAIVNAVQNTFPINNEWVSRYRREAESKLALVSAAATTDSDRNALVLLQKELANMQRLSDKYLALRENLTYIAPDSLESDPLDQQILSCARGLAAAAASGEFQDVAACH